MVEEATKKKQELRDQQDAKKKERVLRKEEPKAKAKPVTLVKNTSTSTPQKKIAPHPGPNVSQQIMQQLLAGQNKNQVGLHTKSQTHTHTHTHTHTFSAVPREGITQQLNTFL